MKKIEAIIKPFRLDDIREGLLEIGVIGMTVIEVNGYGRQRGHKEIYRGAEYEVYYVPKLMIIIYVDDHNADIAVDTIRTCANSGKLGDGKIAVFDMENLIRVRTGESGDNAL